MPPKAKTSKTGDSCPTGYCVKCKKMQTMTQCKKAVAANGRNMVKGVCKSCGTKMNKFV